MPVFKMVSKVVFAHIFTSLDTCWMFFILNESLLMTPDTCNEPDWLVIKFFN